MLFLKFNCVLNKCYVLSKFVYVNKSSLTASCNRKEQESQYCVHWNIWMMGLQLILQFLLMKTRYLQFILNGFFFNFYFFVASCFIFAKDGIGAEQKTLCIDSIFSYLLDYRKNYLNSFKGDFT